MAPRRSGRRNVSAYKKGDYIEYQYKGSTVTGKLSKKSNNSTEAKPIWIVTPSDRRRKNEDIPEKALGKIINAQEAMSNRGPKLKKGSRVTRDSSSPTSGNSNSKSDESLDEPQDPTTPSEDNSKASGFATRKRKGDEMTSGSDRADKHQKIVTFSQDSNTTATSKRKIKKTRKAKSASTRIGTRSTRGSGEAILGLLPENPIKRKMKGKNIKKDENVTVVTMLTGTLYLYRGDRPRAEFVRSR